MMLKTKWIDLLLLLNQKPISFDGQNIYKTSQFYNIMRELVKLGFVKYKTVRVNGFYKKEYYLTFSGEKAVFFAFRRFLTK